MHNNEGPRPRAVEDAGRERLRQELSTYLAGFGWRDDDLERLVDQWLCARAGCDTSAQAGDPVGHLEAQLERWSRRIFGDQPVADGSPLLVARAAFRACEGPRRWRDCFLGEELREGFVEAMRAAASPPTPPEDGGAMPDQRFEFWSLADLLPGRGLATRLLPVERRATAPVLARSGERRAQP